MDDYQRFWLAGLLEGEGSFRFSKRSARVEVSMTDKDVIERAANIMGTYCRDRGYMTRSRKPVYRALIGGEVAVQLMRSLLPLMGLRRRQQIISTLNGSSARRGQPKGEKNNRAKLKRGDVIEIRRQREAGQSTGVLAKRFGVTMSAISSITLGKTWKHIPYLRNGEPIKGLDRHHMRGEKNPRARLTRQQVIDIRLRASTGETTSGMLADYPVGRSTINRVISGKRWNHST